MNVKNLGIPIYGEGTYRYVLVEDLKLALDSDVFERVMNQPKSTRYGPDGEGILVTWLENQH